MDVSDGVARDLYRLCAASGVGAEITAEELPFADRFSRLCATIDADPFALALGGGEDYVLLFTLPPGIAPPHAGCRRIGRITKVKKIVLRRGGSASVLPEIGWDHLEQVDKQQKTPAP
jgi:thiamine-monophosphate kinase